MSDVLVAKLDWLCGLKFRGRERNAEVRVLYQLEPVSLVMKKFRLR